VSAKRKAKKTTPSNGSAMASVKDIAAHASHLREVIAIVRAASLEYIGQFSGIGHDLPELLLQRDGQGARAATVEAVLEAEGLLEGIARDLESRANALLSTTVESSGMLDHVHAVPGIGLDQVVRREGLSSILRPRRHETSPTRE
jgi:hypothetical protein